MAGCGEIIKMLLCHLSSSSSQHGDEDGCSLSLCCKFEIAGCMVMMKLSKHNFFYAWAAVPSQQRIASSSSQHGDEDGCSLSLCGKVGKAEL